MKNFELQYSSGSVAGQPSVILNQDVADYSGNTVLELQAFSRMRSVKLGLHDNEVKQMYNYLGEFLNQRCKYKKRNS